MAYRSAQEEDRLKTHIPGNLEEIFLLVSADWSAPLLSVDFEIPLESIIEIQGAARLAVKHMMSSSPEATNLYEIEMTERRKEETWREFGEALKGSAAAGMNLLLEIAENSHKQVLDSNILWLVIEDIFANRVDGINAAVDSANTIFDAVSSTPCRDYDEIQSASTTDWDEYLVKLTPVSRTCLADFYDVRIDTQNSFNTFWAHTKVSLDEAKLKELRELLIKGYQSLTETPLLNVNWL